MTPIAPLITAFLRQHMPIERGYSPQTCETYAARVLGFLTHIEQNRSKDAATRNSRLAAIKAFMLYVEFRVPSALDQIRQIHAIPTKRCDQALVRHLTMDEVRAILDAPNLTTRLGIRDRAMLHLCFARMRIACVGIGAASTGAGLPTTTDRPRGRPQQEHGR